jgi:hypothetical protein
MHLEKRVRKTMSEVVQIGEVDLQDRSHKMAPDVYLAASG